MTTTDKDFKVKNGIVVGGSGVFSGTVEVATPTADEHAATKAYVDQNAGGILVSENPPASPSEGDQWYNSLDGVTYIYYDNFWVESSSGGQEASLDGYATEQYVDDAIAAIPAPDFTGYATETYVTTAVSNLVDSAPTTLDTLNELAAALGDDANYAATVTTALGNKQDKVSGVSDTEIGYLDGVTSSIQTQLNDKVAVLQPIQELTGNYTIQVGDNGKFFHSNQTSNVVVTFELANIEVGQRFDFFQRNTGKIQVANGGGVQFDSNEGKFYTNGVGTAMSVLCYRTDAGGGKRLVLIGNLS